MNLFMGGLDVTPAPPGATMKPMVLSFVFSARFIKSPLGEQSDSGVPMLRNKGFNSWQRVSLIIYTESITVWITRRLALKLGIGVSKERKSTFEDSLMTRFKVRAIHMGA